MLLALLLIVVIWIAGIWLLYQKGEERPRLRALALDMAAAGGLLALVLAFFWRTLTGDVYQPADGGDLVSFLFPTYRFAARTLAQGTLPLWNPHLYGGASFINDIQAGFLYLPNLLLFLVNPEFPYTVMQWLAVLHLWWAGLGMYVLVRVLRPGGEALHPLAAFFGAVVFAFCDPLLLHLGNLNLIAVLAWLPWVMTALHRALEQRSLRWAAVAGILFAAGSYAGHAQSSLLVGMGMATYALAWAAVSIGNPWHGASAQGAAPTDLTDTGAPRESGRAIRYTFFWMLLLLATAFVLAGLLLAPILLPALDGVAQSIRTEFTYQESVAYSLAPAQLVGLLSPSFFGRGPALHWSLWERVELPYLGVPALLMAIAALWLAPPARRRALYAWMFVALFGLLVALGIYGILHGVLTAIVPFFNQLRAPARTLILFALGGSVLAAAGLDVILKAGVPEKSAYWGLLKWGSILLVGVFIPLLFVALVITQSSDELFLRASVALLAMVLAAAAWLLTWLLVAARSQRRLTPLVFAGLMVALLFFELAAAGAYTDISADDPTTTYQHPEIEALLRADADLFRIDTLTDIADLWQPDTAALLGFEDVGGIANPLLSQAWSAYWEATGGRDTNAYQALNVKYLIARDGTPLPDNWELALDAPDALSVWRNREFRPHAWFVADGGDPLAAPDGSTPVTVTRTSANALTIRLETIESGTLVISEAMQSGWRALINGAEGRPYAVAGYLMAIPVPAGQIEIQLFYTSPSFRVGLWLLALGAVCAVALLLWGRARTSPQA